jgi:hypothetical protein
MRAIEVCLGFDKESSSSKSKKEKSKAKNYTLTVRSFEFLSKMNEKQKNQTWSTRSLQVISSQNRCGAPSPNMFYIWYITFSDPLVLGGPSFIRTVRVGLGI